MSTFNSSNEKKKKKKKSTQNKLELCRFHHRDDIITSAEHVWPEWHQSITLSKPLDTPPTHPPPPLRGHLEEDSTFHQAHQTTAFASCLCSTQFHMRQTQEWPEGGWAEQNVCDKNETVCVWRGSCPACSCWDGCSCLGSSMMIKAKRLWGKIRQLGEYTQTRTEVNKRHKHADKHQRLQMKTDDSGDSRIAQAGAMKLEKAFIFKIKYLSLCS